MLFSIIYSADCPAEIDITEFAPPEPELFDETEDDDQYSYGYLEGDWLEGHHRKWCGILNRSQFQEFVDHTGLFAEDIETLGAIGGPGFGIAWAPAISFTHDDPQAIQSAYVTPIPEVQRSEFTQRDWERVRRAVLSLFG